MSIEKMSNNKQSSSVDWLIREIQRRVAIIQSEPQTMARELMINNLAVDLEQAKAKHYEECKESYYESLLSNFQNFDDYYNETFGGNK